MNTLSEFTLYLLNSQTQVKYQATYRQWEKALVWTLANVDGIKSPRVKACLQKALIQDSTATRHKE